MPTEYTMQTAVINSKGTQFAYYDSGAPTGDTYQTMVIVHGLSFSADIFTRLLPKAAEQNIRVIAVNRRDYRGSTLYSEEELVAAKSTDSKARKAFLQQRGLEMAELLAWVIDEKKIPKLSEDRKIGGLLILGWSLGTVFTIAFGAFLNTYPKELVERLQSYLRTVILYESGTVVIGVHDPEPVGVLDTSTDDAERIAAFPLWVSSYFSHPYFNQAHDVSAEDDSKAESEKVFAQLQIRTPPPGTAPRVASLECGDSKEFLGTMDVAPFSRSDVFFHATIDYALRRAMWIGALSLTDNSVLPDVNFHAVFCTATVWPCVMALWAMKKDKADWEAAGKPIRRFDFTVVEGENHFWDDPIKFLKVMPGPA